MTDALSHSPWPLEDLRITAGRWEMRLPDNLEVGEFALSVADEYPPCVPSLANPNDTPEERARRIMQGHRRIRADWKPENWALDLFAFEDGRPVGQQRIVATDFAVLGEVETGSIVRPGHRGAGIGTAMRSAALHLAFEELGARFAITRAERTNRASRAVTAKFGYEQDGQCRMNLYVAVWDGDFFRLRPDRWRDNAPELEVRITGVEGNRALFGCPLV